MGVALFFFHSPIIFDLIVHLIHIHLVLILNAKNNNIRAGCNVCTMCISMTSSKLYYCSRSPIWQTRLENCTFVSRQFHHTNSINWKRPLWILFDNWQWHTILQFPSMLSVWILAFVAAILHHRSQCHTSTPLQYITSDLWRIFSIIFIEDLIICFVRSHLPFYPPISLSFSLPPAVDDGKIMHFISGKQNTCDKRKNE